MLILNNSDVQYCQVSHFKGNKTKNLLGIKYKGHLFLKSKTYANNQLQNAIERSRHFLDLEKPVVSIILKEDKHISVWFEYKKIKSIKMLENKLERNLKMTTNKLRSAF